jgi:hypothetical protein
MLHLLSETDASIRAKVNFNPGLPPSTVSADMSSAGSAHLGLVAYLNADVDGGYTGISRSHLFAQQFFHQQNVFLGKSLRLQQARLNHIHVILQRWVKNMCPEQGLLFEAQMQGAFE